MAMPGLPILAATFPVLYAASELLVESDSTLASDVAAVITPTAKRLRRPVPTVGPIGGAPSPRLSTTPAVLLHALARATAIPSLPIAALNLTWLWPQLRYCWAFSDAQAPLVSLAAETDVIRRHQRTLLSEQLGIAAAIVVVESTLGYAAQIVDAEWFSVQPGAYPGVPFAARSGVLSPDYYLFDPTVQELIVLECKGNSNGRNHMVRQLATGALQVAEPAAAAPAGVRRMVVGCVASRATRGVSAHGVEVQRHGVSAGYVRQQQEANAQRLIELSAARSLAYAGAHAEALSLLSDSPRPQPTTLLDLDSPAGSARGIQISASGVTVELGLLESAYEVYRAPDGQSLLQMRAEIRTRISRALEPVGDSVDIGIVRRDESVWTAAADGTVMRLSM